MKKLLSSSVVLLQILLFSCKEDKPNEIKLPQFQLQVTDTLVVDYSGKLEITDYDYAKGHYLAVDVSQKEASVIVFDEEGEVIQTFLNSEGGANSFKGKLFGLSYDMTKEGFLLTSKEGVYHYNNEWVLQAFWKNPKANEIAKWPVSYKQFKIITQLEDTVLPTCLITTLNNSKAEGNLQQRSYYQSAKDITLINLKDKSFKNVIGFDSNSNYLSEDVLYSPHFSYYGYDSSTKTLLLTRSNDHNLYYYDFVEDSFHLSSYQYLNLDFYAIQSNNRYGADFNVFETGFDSRIENLVATEDRVFLSYVKSFNKEAFIKQNGQFKNSPFYREFIYENIQYCLHIRDRQKKISKDVIVPKFMFSPVLAYNNEELLFKPASHNFELDKEAFFKIKIIAE